MGDGVNGTLVGNTHSPNGCRCTIQFRDFPTDLRIQPSVPQPVAALLCRRSQGQTGSRAPHISDRQPLAGRHDQPLPGQAVGTGSSTKDMTAGKRISQSK